ncbi:hypothetical protein ES703_114233 [subsurface metagenome]
MVTAENVQIIVRGDSGFCREQIMLWCERNNVDYVFGLAKNERLKKEIAKELQQAKELYEQTFQAARVFKDFEYKTLKSWSKSRRVVGKAEHLQKGANPRFVVTSLSTEQFDAKTLYEDQYYGLVSNNLFLNRDKIHISRFYPSQADYIVG